MDEVNAAELADEQEIEEEIKTTHQAMAKIQLRIFKRQRAIPPKKRKRKA